MTEPLAYRLAHLREAILKDERFTDQAVEVDVAEGRVVLRGEVATPARRSGIVALVSELAPDLHVVDDLCVSAGLAAQPDAEHL